MAVGQGNRGGHTKSADTGKGENVHTVLAADSNTRGPLIQIVRRLISKNADISTRECVGEEINVDSDMS